MQKFLIYVENKFSSESPYYVSEGAIRGALGPMAATAEIMCRAEAEFDPGGLARADYFVGSGFDTQRLRNHARSLRLVHCTSAGVEKYMPLDWLPNGASLSNSSGVHAEKGGAFGAMTVLMLCEGLPRHIANQKAHRWDERLSGSIVRKTVVIVGFGALGSAIASRLKPFGPRIIGISRSGTQNELADEMVPISDMASVLPVADCVVVSCPLTPETRGLIGEAQLALMKPGSALFNIARGPVVNTVALQKALETGHLSGAALDVFDQEPLPSNSALWDVPNLMIFPHISCDDADGYVDRCLAIFAENVARDRAGKPLLNCVDSAAGY